MKGEIGRMFKSDFDGKSSYPDVEKITGVFEAKNFTLDDIRAAIKEKSSESWPNIGERFHEFFIEGSDGKILIKFKDL